MLAAILEKQNAPLVLDELKIPELSFGQVLVRVKCSGICGAQINEISGAKGPDSHLPHLLGHEGGGIVEAIGPGVARVAPGNHTVIHWRCGAGINSALPRYERMNGGGSVGSGANSTFQEYSIVSENRLTVIEPDTPHDIAALMGCAVTTGIGAVRHEANLKEGQKIAVIGCGGVGLNVIQGARIAGAGVIVAVDVLDDKLDMAIALGAHASVNFRTNPTGIEFIRGMDVIVDTTGIPGLISEAYGLIAPGGKVIMVGQPRRGDALVLPDIAQNMKGKMLMDSTGGSTNPNIDIPLYLRWYHRGLLRLDSLITHRFPLDQVNEAIEVVKSGIAGKVILEMK